MHTDNTIRWWSLTTQFWGDAAETVAIFPPSFSPRDAYAEGTLDLCGGLTDTGITPVPFGPDTWMLVAFPDDDYAEGFTFPIVEGMATLTRVDGFRAVRGIAP